jgi:hypothetical protein
MEGLLSFAMQCLEYSRTCLSLYSVLLFILECCLSLLELKIKNTINTSSKNSEVCSIKTVHDPIKMLRFECNFHLNHTSQNFYPK